MVSMTKHFLFYKLTSSCLLPIFLVHGRDSLFHAVSKSIDQNNELEDHTVGSVEGQVHSKRHRPDWLAVRYSSEQLSTTHFLVYSIPLGMLYFATHEVRIKGASGQNHTPG